MPRQQVNAKVIQDRLNRDVGLGKSIGLKVRRNEENTINVCYSRFNSGMRFTEKI